MKKRLLLLAILFLATLSFNVVASEFLEYIDGISFTTKSLIETSDNGFVISGYGGNDGNDIILVKLNANGIEEWTKTIGGSSGDYGYSVIETSDGSFLVTGLTSSYGDSDYDIILIKFNSNGVEQWTKTLIGSSYDYGYSVIETSDNGFVLAGGVQSYGAGSSDIVLIKFNSEGVEQWTKTLGDTGYDVAKSLVETSDGSIVVSGETTSYGSNNGDIILVKFNSNGVEQWTKTIGVLANNFLESLVEGSDGSFIVSGNTKGFVGDKDIILVKFNSEGVEQWTKTLGDTGNDVAKSLVETSDGSIVVSGTTSSYGVDSQDIFISKFNSNGVEQWTKTFGGGTFHSLGSMIESSDEGLVFVGDNSSNAFILKTDSDGNIPGCSSLVTQSDSETDETVSEVDQSVSEVDQSVSFSDETVSEVDIDNILSEKICHYPSYVVDEPSWSEGYDLYDLYGNLISGEFFDKILTIRDSELRIVTQFNASSDINLTNVTVGSDESSGKSFVANLSSVISGEHILYVPRVSNEGVYICPDAESLEEVYFGCAGMYSYSSGECISGSGECSLISQEGVNYFRVEGVEGSGGGNILPSSGVPEFSTYAFIVAISITLFGFFVFRRE